MRPPGVAQPLDPPDCKLNRSRPAILILRLPGQVDAIGGHNHWEPLMVRKPAPAVAQGTSGSYARLSGIDPPGFVSNARTENQQVTVVPCKRGGPPWERGHPPPPPCGGRLARLNTPVGLRRVVHCRPPAGCGRDARAPRGALRHAGCVGAGVRCAKKRIAGSGQDARQASSVSTPHPAIAPRITTSHGGSFHDTSRANAASASTKSLAERTPLVHTGS